MPNKPTGPAPSARAAARRREGASGERQTGAVPRTSIPAAPQPAAPQNPSALSPAAASSSAALAAAARLAQRQDPPSDSPDDGDVIRVDTTALCLSRREAEQARETCEPFLLYQTGEASSCHSIRRFIPKHDWFSFAGEFVRSSICFRIVGNLRLVQSLFNTSHRPLH